MEDILEHLYNYEYETTLGILGVLAILLIIESWVAGTYFSKCLGKSKGWKSLLIVTLMNLLISLLLGVIVDGFPFKVGSAGTNVWYTLYTLIVMFFLLYIGIFIFSILFGHIVLFFKGIKKRRNNRRARRKRAKDKE